MYFLNLISFFLFHWFEITQSRNIQQCPECIFSLKIQSTPIQNYSGLNSMPQAVDCESQPVTGACKMLQMSRRRPYFLIDCLQMSRNRYVLECIHRRGWSHSTETHFTPMKSTGSFLFTWETSHLKFAHERCVTSSRSRGNSRLNND